MLSHNEHRHPYWLSRTELLTGKEALARIREAHVLIVGLGGVGSFAAEYICRAGVGKMTIVDGDTVDASNRNRQLQALHSTEGQEKVQLMANRLLDINPELQLRTVGHFMNPERFEALFDQHIDYAIDAIDTFAPKIELIKQCTSRGIPLISSMGAGGKFDPEKVHTTDIAKTHTCPMAQELRKQLRRAGIKVKFKAVFSTEMPRRQSLQMVEGATNKKSFFGTISYLPSLFGCHCAANVIQDLMNDNLTQ